MDPVIEELQYQREWARKRAAMNLIQGDKRQAEGSPDLARGDWSKYAAYCKMYERLSSRISYLRRYG